MVKPESKAALDEVAKLLKSDPGLKLWVVGRTDSVGKENDTEAGRAKNRRVELVRAPG